MQHSLTAGGGGGGIQLIDIEQLVLFSLAFFVTICVVILCTLCTRPFNQQQGTTNEAVATTGTTGTTASNEPRRELSLPEKIIRMTKKDRFQYYSSLFEMNNNQIKLTPDQIIKGNSENSNNKKEEQKNETNLEISAASPDDEEEDEEEPSIYLSLDIVWDRFIRRSSAICNNNNNIKRSSSVVIHKSGRTKTVEGNCIICFENFEAGNTIVYSKETTDCHHVYHKNCMVEYLANRKLYRSQLKTGETDPSCPTCRQKFCKLIPLLDKDTSNTDTMEQSTDDEDQDHHISREIEYGSSP